MLSKSESEKYNIFNNNLECLTTAIVSKNLDDLQIGLIQSFSQNTNSNNVHDNVQNKIITFSINENNSQPNENSFQSKIEDEINIENFFLFQKESINEISENNNSHLYIPGKDCQNKTSKIYSSKSIDNLEQFKKDSFLNKKTKRKLSNERKNTKKNKKIRSTHDYLIKSFISNFINTYLFNKLNKLSKICNFGKIYKSNYKINVNPKETELLSFLKKNVKEIFSSFNENAEEYRNQQKNHNLIEKLYNKINLSVEEKELKKVLDSLSEEELILYYQSDEIEKFKNKKLKHGTPAYYDKQFYKERNRNYYLLEPYGFIRYAKSKPYCHNKRKKNKGFYYLCQK